MAYEINYDDKRFTEVESQKSDALSDLEQTYAGMINDSDKYYQAQIDASKQWADKQTDLQNQKTDLAIKEINQQKDQTKKDYLKEQSGAYVDWRKQSNEYGVESEEMAAAGLTNTGYSESSQVSMYNTYQNRVATAREAYGRAVLNYDNSIAEARLQNSSVLAEIAYEALQKQLELSLQGFQYKNQLLLDKADKKTQIENEYYQRYQDVLAQINHENALAEQVRQYNESLAEEKRQYNQTLAMQQAQLAEEKRQFNALHTSSSGGGGGSGGSGGSGGGGGGKVAKKEHGGGGGSFGSVSNKSTEQKGASAAAKKSVASGAKEGKEIDMQSVLALGYGPISASRLNELEKQGLIQSYTSGGKIKFRKSSYAIKQSMLFKG